MKKNLMAALCALLVCVLTMTGASAEGSVAGESDMTDVIDIVPEGMTPVTADMLNDGTWFVNVDVSSSMFKVNGAEVTVEGGALTARLLMNSEAYSYMYPGEAEEAAAADESAWIALETDGEDVHSFTMPVEGLNQVFHGLLTGSGGKAFLVQNVQMSVCAAAIGDRALRPADINPQKMLLIHVVY